MGDAWQEYLQNQERNDGVRFTWNVWPHSRLEATRCIVPFGAFYTPLCERPADSPQPPPLHYDPVLCTKNSCKAVLNPFCQVDFRTKTWGCPFCHQRSPFPPHYAMIAENNLPPELAPQFTSIEYTLTKATTMPPIFLFVVDTCLNDEKEHSGLKESLQTALSLLPVNAMVGLITYGRMVHIHELGVQGMPRAYVFKGAKEVTKEQIKKIVVRNSGPRPGQPSGNTPGQTTPKGPMGAAINKPPGPGQMPAQQQSHNASQPVGGVGHALHNKFLQPISDCDLSINDLIAQLQPDGWPVPKGQRPLRATGSALSAAISLLEVSYPNTGARVMLFIGGACSHGPGAIVDEQLKNPIRSWHTIKEDNAKFIKKAMKHYDALANRAVSNGHTVDIYSCALDQTGLHEMKNLFSLTGGNVVLGDSFDSSLFKQSYQRVFEKDAQGHLKMAFNATLEVKVGKDMRLEGALGNCANLHIKNASVSDTEFGMAGTCQWKFCALTPKTTPAFVFEIAGSSAAAPPAGARGFVQFVMAYQHSSGQKRIRVTTTGRNWVDMATAQPQIAYGFDQEASAALMARLACWRAMSEGDTPDALRWLDRSLIRLCQKFGEYVKEDQSSFRLSDQLSMFPQFIFHLRRSQFMQVFNNSPDESAYYRHALMHERVIEQITMIQPVLYSYSFNGPPEPALLDSSSIQADKILLMDDYFHVLIYHGKTIAAWKKMGYAEDPQYETFKQLLDAPIQDAVSLLADRFPIPRYIVTEYEGSQARFLMAKVNPSVTHNNPYGGSSQDGSDMVLTDDVSLQTFMEHLKKLSVSQST